MHAVERLRMRLVLILRRMAAFIVPVRPTVAPIVSGCRVWVDCVMCLPEGVAPIEFSWTLRLVTPTCEHVPGLWGPPGDAVSRALSAVVDAVAADDAEDCPTVSGGAPSRVVVRTHGRGRAA